MKQTEVTSIGGRIRKARIEANLSIRALSEKVGVTATYLGMVERSEKNPSASLLQKIAQETGSSVERLEKNAADRTEQPGNVREPGSRTSVPVNIDVPLFLFMALQAVPNITREKLAVMLDVSSEDIDNILSGRGGEYAPRWGDCFSLLARRMDIPAVSRKICDIDLFLRHENMEKKRKCLYDSLKSYAGSEYQYLAHVSRTFDREDLYSESIILQKAGFPGEGDWNFIFYRFEGSADEFPADMVVGEYLINYNISFAKRAHVFEDEKIIDVISDYYEERQGQEDALAAKSGWLRNTLPSITLLLVDSVTWKYEKEFLLRDDDDDLEL